MGLKMQVFGKGKNMYVDINLESPKNLTWPNLNKPVTGKFGSTMSTKPHFLGSGPFSEASYRPLTQFFQRSEKDLQG